jgi:hypothetical protein
MTEHSENAEQKAKNLPPKRPLPRKNAPGWDVFWIISAIIVILALYFATKYVVFPRELYPRIAEIALISLIVTFLISSKTVKDGYSIPKQAICYMGSLKGRRSGRSNATALIFFIVFAVLYVLLNFTLMSYFTHYIPDDNRFRWATFFLGFSALVIFMMSIIPIDVHQLKHLYTALLVFAITEFSSGVILSHFIVNKIAYPIMYVVVTIEFILAALYIWGYITDYRYTPVFQKTCIMFTGIAFYLYLIYLVAHP